MVEFPAFREMVTQAYVLFGVGIPLKNRGDLLTDTVSTLVAGRVADVASPVPCITRVPAHNVIHF
jgi:hypothetical protein